MTASPRLLLVFHHHCAPGTPEPARAEAYWGIYEPLLTALESRPAIRAALHYSGCLLDDLLTHHPDFVDRLRAAAERGQAEFLSGAYYEPMLCAIPEADRIGQIAKMNELLRRYLGVQPSGMWLAGRLWEPHLPAAIARAGLRYTVLDETHLRLAGVGADRCSGYWRTEELGWTTAVFPAVDESRWLQRLAEPQRAIEALAARAAAVGDAPLTLAVEVDRWGALPDVHRLLHDDGPLQSWLETLERAADRLPTGLPGEVLDARPPQGTLAVPSAAPLEALPWGLAPDRHPVWERARAAAEAAADGDPWRPLPAAGSWRAIFARHPEADQLHKKMLAISRRIERGLALLPRDQALHSAREFLWRGQCGDAYRHEGRGGLLDPRLRHEAYRNLIVAGRLLGESVHGEEPWLTAERLDYDADGHDELVVETDRWELVCAPAQGGALVEVNYKPCDVNLADVLTVRPVIDPTAGRAAAGAEAAAEDLVPDSHRRLWGTDRFLPPDATFQEFVGRRLVELGDFVARPYQDRPTLSGRSLAIPMKRVASARVAGGDLAVSVTKQVQITAGEDGWTWTWRIKNLGDRPLHCLWGPEWNVALPETEGADAVFFVQQQPVRRRRMAADEAHEGVECFGVAEGALDLRVMFYLSEPARLWRHAIVQPVLGDGGRLERVVQGVCLLPHWPLRLEPGMHHQWTIRLACTHRTAPSRPEAPRPGAL